MKIAYFLDVPVGLGGAGNALLEQAKIISKIYEVIVVIPCKEDGVVNPEYKKRCEKAQVNHVGMYYHTAYSIQYIDIKTAWEIMENIQKFIMQEKVDLVHSVQLNVAVELAARRCSIPHLMNIYQLREEEFVVKYLDIFPRYHSCDSLLYCNRWSKMLEIESRCIRPAAQLEEIKIKLKVDKQKKGIIMLGSVCERKNQLAAIKAVMACRNQGKNITLTIAGNDSSKYAQDCRRYIEDNHAIDVIHMVGFQSDITPLLEENDLFLCTSIDESFPSSIVEAMTYDLAVISTPVAGVPELMINKENSYISRGFGVSDIIESILECLDDYVTGAIDTILENARTTWNENFSRNVICDQLKTYYLHMLSSDKGYMGDVFDDIEYSDGIKSIYHKIQQSDIEDSLVYKRCYYYTFLKKNLKSGKVYIWGAGKYGGIAKKLIEILFDDIEIEAFLDSKKTDEYLGIPIVSPEMADYNKVTYVFLAFAAGREQVISYLENQNLKYNDRAWLLP